MFNDRLRAILDRVDRGLALSLVAADGIPVESVQLDPALDLELLAAEMMAQVRAVSLNHRELSVGQVRHVGVTTDRLSMMVTSISPEYYLLLVQRSGANAGRARFELRRAMLAFEGDL